MNKQLLVATHNQGKLKEIRAMLEPHGIECFSLSDANITFDVEETGTTFVENAILKATQYAKLSGMLTLADDSGLEVDALDGAPGVYTARFGGDDITQPERNQLLLTKIEEANDRGAQFQCVMILADTNEDVLAETHGICRGTIALAPSGDGGFGYDPIFYLPEKEVTMAHLTKAEKGEFSHRGKALRAMIPAIVEALR